MTENCFDIGEIQAFLDGELASEQSELIARHVSLCDDCAIMLATAEDETAFAYGALEQEFNTLVPTQRLWTKINDSIEREKKSFWKPIFAFLLQPSTMAFASLLFVAVVSITLLSMKPDAPTNYVAEKSEIKQNTIQPIVQNPQTPIVQVPQDAPEVKSVETAAVVRQNKNEYRPAKAVYVKEEIKPRIDFLPTPITDVPRESVQGEESYIKTIATLTQTVNSRKDTTLNSSARFAFERDLAMTDDAIIKLRKEVKQNPNNAAAKQILRASYQNKIDLLNSVAEKTELMASLK